MYVVIMSWVLAMKKYSHPAAMCLARTERVMMEQRARDHGGTEGQQWHIVSRQVLLDGPSSMGSQHYWYCNSPIVPHMVSADGVVSCIRTCM